MKINDPKEIIKLLDLKPLEIEGGYFKETYRSDDSIPKDILPSWYRSSRCFSTAIYYLLTPDNFSAIHKVNSDELFHFYLGDPVEMLLLYPDGKGRKAVLGQDIKRGQQVQMVVPRGVWQGAVLQEGGGFALLGTTVSPGFEYEDFIPGEKDLLTKEYPEHVPEIIKLFRNSFND